MDPMEGCTHDFCEEDAEGEEWDSYTDTDSCKSFLSIQKGSVALFTSLTSPFRSVCVVCVCVCV